jgi:hypothetical protein
MFSSMEVSRATDVALDDRRPVRGGYGPLAIAVGLQDRADGGVGAGADLKRPGAGGLKPLSPVTLGQPQDADAGPEALLGVGLLGEDELDECRRVAPDLARLPLQALRRPVRVLDGMCSRTVVCLRSEDDRRCAAMRLPLWNSSTVRVVMRAHNFSRSS